MASTRNKNTSINYSLEEARYKNFETYNLYKNGSSGEAINTNLAGNGVLQGAVAWNKLSHNPADVESFLFGIGTTNLVNPMKHFTPELVQNNTVDFFKKTPTYMPDPLIVEKSQRPGFLN
jgi:hypothetical protein